MEVVDAHHHYLEPSAPWATFLGSLGAPAYSPQEYQADFGSAWPRLVKTVHVEAMPDDGAAEAAWVAALGAPKTAAIVANCDLSAADASSRLEALSRASPMVRGVRYILDWDGAAFDGHKTNGTHVFTTSHAKGDLLRGPAKEDFERGYALLADRGWTFDLQCAPSQLGAAAALAGRHPKTKLVVCHLGKVRGLGSGGPADDERLAEWRRGMAEMAALPNVYVKLSMLGFAYPGWVADADKEKRVKDLVLELVALFGPRRCMFATNWHINASLSDADVGHPPAPTIPQLIAKLEEWTSHLPEADRLAIFRGTAEEFYRI